MAAATILLTNDDGYTSAGLHALAEALEPLAEVWVVAPNREQSAVSHALTLDRPLRRQRLGPRRFAVDGTPTDCVALGISKVLEGRVPDLVVSGINFGCNMGADVHYSGTVSAAFEGVILGVPAIAVSQQVDEGFTFAAAADFTRGLVTWALAGGVAADTVLNVNVPVRPRGVRLTRLGVRRYTEGVLQELDPRGREIFWIGGGKPVWEELEGTDFHELHQGWITVTPLFLDMTHQRVLASLVEQAPSWLEGGADHD
jgi:5'-nucleotidase